MWNIDKKLSILVVDNCSTNDAIVDDVLTKLQHISLMLCDSLFHMCCYAHILNLVVQDGLSVIKVVIAKISNSVAYWTTSPQKSKNLMK